VQLFILGENKWRGEYEWPLARTRYTEFFLHSRGSANTVRGDGWLSTEPPAADDQPDTYAYDPRDPVMSLMRSDSQAAPVDQSPHDHRADILVYQTAPLAADIEVTGPVVLKLWAASDCPDTDWTAKLAVVFADGLCVNLTYGIMRARYRDGFENPSPIEPGKPYLYALKLNPTGILFRRGERIRLSVSSSDFPNFDRNHNTGRDYWSDPELRVAHQTVFHAGDQRSCLTLPVIPR
jgi:putative CocE/NonD family hydrolase